MSIPGEATSGDLRVVFWIGDSLSDEVDSAAFAGMPIDLVFADIQSVYDVPDSATVLVNDVPVSRHEYLLEVGDEVTIIRAGSQAITAKPPPLSSPVSADETLPGRIADPKFKFDGATWHLEFGAEKCPFTTTMHGFRLYGALLENPDTDLLVLDLEQKAGLGRPVTEKGGQGRADAAVDPQGMRKIREEIQRIEKEIEDTVNPERIAELEQMKQDLLAHRDKLVNKHGKSRTIGLPTELEKARMRVHNNLDRARQFIAKSMPEFAKYLENTVQWNSPAWSYRPARHPKVT